MPRSFALVVAARVLLVAAMVGPAGVAAQPATPVPAGPLDLAAIALTPDDLPDDGFALVDHGLVPAAAETRLAEFASRDEADARARGGALGWDPAAAGWRRRYEQTLAQPAPGAPDRFGMAVRSAVTEYASAGQAAAAFALLEDETDVPDATDLDDPPPIGDAAELTRFGGVTRYTNLPGQIVPYEELELSFRLGDLIGSVALADFTTLAPPRGTVERLGATLAARMAVARTATGGAGTLVLRLAGPGVGTGGDEGYLRRDGDTVPVFNDLQGDIDYRNEAFAGTTDVYSLGLPVGTTGYYLARVYRFGTVEAAEAWLRAEPDRLARNPGRYVDLRPVADAGVVGDGSATLALGWSGPNATTRGHRIYARVGAEVAVTHLDALPDAPLATVAALATAQAACLRAGACPEPVTTPAALGGPNAAPPTDGRWGPG